MLRRDYNIQLLTAQSVFEYIANGNSPDVQLNDKIRTVRVPFVPRTMSFRRAFRLMSQRVCVSRMLMMVQNIPLLLVYLNKSDKDNVLKQTGVVYPNVVTYSQIYNIICQRKFEERRWELDELENGAQAVVDMEGSDSSLDIEDMSLKQKLTYAFTVLCEHYSGNRRGR